MREHERESARDDAFEALLAQSVDELPPEEIVADVTPWRRAMERVLFGLALCMVTLNFWCLNYLLPAIGTVLLLLGFRALRRENPWLRGCFVCAVLRTACVFPSLIANTTILPGDACRSAAAPCSGRTISTTSSTAGANSRCPPCRSAGRGSPSRRVRMRPRPGAGSQRPPAASPACLFRARRPGRLQAATV